MDRFRKRKGGQGKKDEKIALSPKMRGKKDEIKEKKRYINLIKQHKCLRYINLSKQESMTCLRVCSLCFFFVSLSFVLEKIFLVQRHNNHMYSRSYKLPTHELSLTKLKLRLVWKLP